MGTIATTIHDAVQRVIDSANNEVKRVAAALHTATNPADVQTAIADLNALADRLDAFDPATQLLPSTPAGVPTSSGSPSEPQNPSSANGSGSGQVTVPAGNPIPENQGSTPTDPSQDAGDPSPVDPSQQTS